MSFFRKKDKDEAPAATQPSPPSPPSAEDPDPSTWALPADAAVNAPPPDPEALAGDKTAETVVRPIPTTPPAAASAEADARDAIPIIEPEPTAGAGGAALGAEASAQPSPPDLSKADPPAAEPAPDPVLSAATVTSPGVGSQDEPRAAAAASEGARATERPSDRPPLDTLAQQGQDKPELLVAGAFAGAFLFAKILKKLGS